MTSPHTSLARFCLRMQARIESPCRSRSTAGITGSTGAGTATPFAGVTVHSPSQCPGAPHPPVGLRGEGAA
jgi:hypothetical protein